MIYPIKIWQNLGITSKGLVALALPLIILLLSIGYLYQRELAAQSVETELQTAIVELAKIQAIHAQLAEAATGVRGYLLTGRDDFLTRYYQARVSLPTEIKLLNQTLKDKQLLAHFAIMQPLVTQKLSGMKQLLAEGRLVNKNELITILVSQKRILDSIRQQIDLMRDRSTVLIKQKQTSLQDVRKRNLQLTIFSALIGVVSALIAINFYFADIVNRIKHLRDNAALLASGAPLKQANQSADEIGVLAASLENAAKLLSTKQHETELARAEAESANAAKTMFLSRTSHELRTPLNAILGFSQLLKSDLPQGAMQQSATHIETAGNHLLKLINDVLNISRIESGDVNFNICACNIQAVVNEATALLAQVAMQKNITLKANVPITLAVLADKDKLLQILINLISNAIKYGPSNAVIDICCERINAQTHINVKDQGAGVAAHLRARLFTPFDRLGAENTNIDGVGLGLALSKELASAMGGNIGLADEASIFWLSLPTSLMADKPQSLSPTATIVAMPTNKIQHILYVEDNASNLALVQTVLRREVSVALHTETTVKAALNYLIQHPVDLLLLDIHLSDALGDQLLIALRNMPNYAKTPVIVLSADVSPNTIERLIALGANEYLSKPINIHLLMQTIKAHLI